jgi:hypothetical protein
MVRGGCRNTPSGGDHVSSTQTVGFGPLWRVDGPAPVPQQFGLLQAAMTASEPGVTLVTPDVDADGVERWINGVAVYPYPPDLGDVYDPCAPGSVATTKGFGETLENPTFGAMTVWLAETCTSARVSWAGDQGQELFKARANVALSAVDGAAVAYEFMTGARIPANPHLADGVNTAFPLGNTPTSVVNGVATLENYIAAMSGKLGVIHMTPAAATIMGQFRIDNRAGYIRTLNGNIVIPDFGYALANQEESHPANHPAPSGTQEWIYATGAINIRRSELFTQPDNVSEALDRGMGATNNVPNSITYRAERYYVVSYDLAIHAAVLVDRCYIKCDGAD